MKTKLPPFLFLAAFPRVWVLKPERWRKLSRTLRLMNLPTSPDWMRLSAEALLLNSTAEPLPSRGAVLLRQPAQTVHSCRLQQQRLHTVSVNHPFARRPGEDREAAVLRRHERDSVALILGELRRR